MEVVEAGGRIVYVVGGRDVDDIIHGKVEIPIPWDER